MLTPDDVNDVRFAATKFRAGYDQDEVDDFLDRVVAGLRDRAGGGPGLKVADIDTVRFSETKFREGYEMRDVDAFLDRLRVELGGSPAPAGVDTPAPAKDADVPGLLPPRRGFFGRRR